jgi:5-enolpyruvylshikimate-3-phosphate synthase
MKKHIQKLVLTGFLCLNALIGFSQAEVQIIHNSADPAAAAVDVYVNGSLAVNDFAFRSATSFISLPSGTLINVGIAPPNSMSVNDTLQNFELTLAAGQRYIAVANGVLNPANFSVNPDGSSTAFTLFIQGNIRNMAMNAGDVDFVVVHGASDAPTVDVIARNAGTLVNNASYSNITPYLSVPPASYTLDVTPAAGSPIVASFTANLSALGGGSAVVFASGFLDSTLNQNGAAFGLFAALGSGTVIQLPSVSTARLQVIHNAADPAAASVDVYINGALALNDFAFRTATPFIDVPAGVVLNIGVAGGSSTSVNDTLKNFQVTLANGGQYLAVANGVLNPANFSVNPDGTSTAFTLFLQDQMRESGSTSDVDFRVVHGATDAPTVDVIARNVATLVNNASYSNITPYISVPAASYILDVTPGAGTPIVASFTANLSTLGGGSAVVFASGFLDSTLNQNGAAFGLFAALANGTVLRLPAVSTARLQVIHNASDPAAASVDVYINGALALNDFAFRTATPYIDVPAGVLLNIGVAGGSSTSVNDTLKNFQVTLANGGEYLAVANGVLNPASFAVNPDGASTAFTLFLQDQMRESSLLTTDVDVRVIHGATDAPIVDVLSSGAPVVDNAGYSNITPYLSLVPTNYTLDVTPGSNNSVIVASFQAPLSGLAGKSFVIVASGFLNPAANQNGAAFGLLAVPADGQAFMLPVVTSISESLAFGEVNIFPNPTTEAVVILSNEKTRNANVVISNSLGQIVRSLTLNSSRVTIPLTDVAKGMYFVTIQGEEGQSTTKLIVE